MTSPEYLSPLMDASRSPRPDGGDVNGERFSAASSLQSTRTHLPITPPPSSSSLLSSSSSFPSLPGITTTTPSIYVTLKVYLFVRIFHERIRTRVRAARLRKKKEITAAAKRRLVVDEFCRDAERRAFHEIDRYLGQSEARTCRGGERSAPKSLPPERHLRHLYIGTRSSEELLCALDGSLKGDNKRSLNTIAGNDSIFISRRSEFTNSESKSSLKQLIEILVSIEELLLRIRQTRKIDEAKTAYSGDDDGLERPYHSASIATVTTFDYPVVTTTTAYLANLEHLLLSLKEGLLQAVIGKLIDLVRQHVVECQRDADKHGRGWFFEYPDGQRPLSTTWPWSIRPSLAVLWGVCWMFYDFSGGDTNPQNHRSFSAPSTSDTNNAPSGVGICIFDNAGNMLDEQGAVLLPNQVVEQIFRDWSSSSSTSAAVAAVVAPPTISPGPMGYYPGTLSTVNEAMESWQQHQQLDNPPADDVDVSPTRSSGSPHAAAAAAAAASSVAAPPSSHLGGCTSTGILQPCQASTQQRHQHYQHRNPHPSSHASANAENDDAEVDSEAEAESDDEGDDGANTEVANCDVGGNVNVNEPTIDLTSIQRGNNINDSSSSNNNNIEASGRPSASSSPYRISPDHHHHYYHHQPIESSDAGGSIGFWATQIDRQQRPRDHHPSGLQHQHQLQHQQQRQHQHQHQHQPRRPGTAQPIRDATTSIGATIHPPPRTDPPATRSAGPAASRLARATTTRAAPQESRESRRQRSGKSECENTNALLLSSSSSPAFFLPQDQEHVRGLIDTSPPYPHHQSTPAWDQHRHRHQNHPYQHPYQHHRRHQQQQQQLSSSPSPSGLHYPRQPLQSANYACAPPTTDPALEFSPLLSLSLSPPPPRGSQTATVTLTSTPSIIVPSYPLFPRQPQDLHHHSATSVSVSASLTASSWPVPHDHQHHHQHQHLPHPPGAPLVIDTTHLSPIAPFMPSLEHQEMQTPPRSPHDHHHQHHHLNQMDVNGLHLATRKRSHSVMSGGERATHDELTHHRRSISMEGMEGTSPHGDDFSPRSRTLKRDDPPLNPQGKYFCNVAPECEGQTFDRKCEWNKHMDKHDRPYRCPDPACAKLQGFTYSGGLLRHEREVHGKHGGPKAQLMCPYPNCKRHSGKGFTRKENLNEHVRRVHESRNQASPGGGMPLKRDGPVIDAALLGPDPTETPLSRLSETLVSDDVISPALKRRRGLLPGQSDGNGGGEDIDELHQEVLRLRAENAEKDARLLHMEQKMEEVDRRREEEMSQMHALHEEMRQLRQAQQLQQVLGSVTGQDPKVSV